MKNYDVVIIGGAMTGSSIAWFLSNNRDFNGSVLVIEKDPTSEFSSTAHTNSCMRQQFSLDINVKISQFAADYVKNFRRYMNDDPRVPDVPIHSFGYMYLADNKIAAAKLQEDQKVQKSCGAKTKFMSYDEILKAYPFYKLDDIIGGNHNLVDEGYFDGNTLFDWWKRGARENGVETIKNEVVDLNLNVAGTSVDDVTLASGQKIACGQVINASGPRAAQIAGMAAIALPIEPRKRYTFVFTAQQPLDRDLPLTVDPSGVHMRTDGANYMAGCAPDIDLAVDYNDFEQDHTLWENKVWPALAARIPQFEAIKLINSWVGHYAFNTNDQNAILGPHPRVSNFHFANGFSGHGFQQAPAVGRGISEMIVYGNYRSLDLSPLGFDRLERNEAIPETAVI